MKNDKKKYEEEKQQKYRTDRKKIEKMMETRNTGFIRRSLREDEECLSRL